MSLFCLYAGLREILARWLAFLVGVALLFNVPGHTPQVLQFSLLLGRFGCPWGYIFQIFWTPVRVRGKGGAFSVTRRVPDRVFLHVL